MSISSPWLLALGLLVAAALAAAIVIGGRRRAAALAAAGIVAAPSRRGLQLGRWCTVAGVVVLALAVSGPHARLPVGREAGTVIVTIDVSTSMTATDVAPSRFAAAQQAAIAFIQAQPDTVDVGVVGFNQGAITTTLPNADHTAAITAIKALQVAGGTSLGAAILASLTAITGKTVTLGNGNGSGSGGSGGTGTGGTGTGGTGSGAAPPTDETGSGLDDPSQDGLPTIGFWPSATIVLFSDGEDTGQASATQAAATVAQNAGIHIDTVGVGTAAGATVTAGGYQVHSALNADELTAIAQATGGSYHPATDAAQVNDVASGIDLRLTVADEEVPLAGALVGFALLLLGAGVVLTVLRTGRLV